MPADTAIGPAPAKPRCAESGSGLAVPPLSVYVHLPWCMRKCPYCDFNSHAVGGAMPEEDYVRVLLADLQQELDRAADRHIETVFFGGGTPTLFSAASIGRVLAAIDRHSSLDGMEITLEANPGTVERGRFADYAGVGVNRVSLGAQSFSPTRLAALGRIHSVDEIWRALDDLDLAGIENFNIDLMFGLPGQDPDEAVADVTEALRARPTHVSHYQLTIEPNTLFNRYPPSLPDEDLLAEIELATAVQLSAAGYARYEVSAWAAPGARCRHNENYWRYGDYLGIGAGAHGKLTDVDLDRIERRWKRRHPTEYMTTRRDRMAGRQVVSGSDRSFEFLLNALRLTDGFTASEFTARTGLAMTVLQPHLERARADGLLESPGAGRWRASTRGLRFLNDLQARFLPETDHD